jgi:amino-acid N-acetyltransferase
MRTAASAHPVRFVRRRRVAPVRVRAQQPILRAATKDDARAIHALISDHLSEGHLLPRTIDDIEATVTRFVVACVRKRIVACADLAPLSPSVAEVRSLVVDATARSNGLGQRLVQELARRAARDGFDSLCAFTHAAGYFVRMGFSIVPHTWVPEKIETNCRSCPQFRRCGQYAVSMSLAQPAQSAVPFVPLASLHG